MIYNKRSTTEHKELETMIQDNVSKEHQEEVYVVGKTIKQAVEEKAAEKAREKEAINSRQEM